ncbi:hypothetical protein ACHQM5_029874 [Ranunculus cassubicifolius]
MVEAEGMFRVHQTIGTILCCKCSVPIAPNAVNMCMKCVHFEVDITEGLQKQFTIMHCPKCESYLHPPKTWIKAQLESKELLEFCVKRLKLKKVTLVDAAFVWTEPRSKQIKVKVRVCKEGIEDQTYIADYNLTDHMCESCTRVHSNPDHWIAKVQLRQQVSHRRSFFYLEQIILKHDAACHAINIKQMSQGIDFFFANRTHAMKFIDFVGKFVPVKSPRNSKQLLSRNPKNNKYNYKDTFTVEICPICREDLILLPREVSRCVGNIGPLCLCVKLSNSILLMNPFTLRYAFLDSLQYCKAPFQPLLSRNHLVEYQVLSISPIISESIVGGSKYGLAEVEIARESDFGTTFLVKTHLGHILKDGDYVLGYDLIAAANTNEIELDSYSDVMLVKKSYEKTREKRGGKGRSWKLKLLEKDVDEKMNSEYEQFLRDLEENPELTFNISLYRNKEYQPADVEACLPLDEMLAGLTLRDEDDDDGMTE